MNFSALIRRPLRLAALFLFSCTAFSQDLPFEIRSKAWKNYRLSDSLLRSRNFPGAAKAYAKSTQVIRYFPEAQYNYAVLLWLTGDTVKARSVFAGAVAAGLKFDDTQTFALSPLLRELSGSDNRFTELRKTLYYDEAAAGSHEYAILAELREVDRYFHGTGVSDTSAIARADSSNREQLREILKNINWPGIAEAGYKGETTAFLIALHADSDVSFQRECVRRMETEFLKGNVMPQHYARLIDRYRENTGRKQLFGTHKSAAKTELEYPADVEYLRKLFGI